MFGHSCWCFQTNEKSPKGLSWPQIRSAPRALCEDRNSSELPSNRRVQQWQTRGSRDPVLLQAAAPWEGIPTEVRGLGKEAVCGKHVFLQSKPALSPAFIY